MRTSIIAPALLGMSGAAIGAFSGGWALGGVMITLGAVACWVELRPGGTNDAEERGHDQINRFAAEIDFRSNYRSSRGWAMVRPERFNASMAATPAPAAARV